MEIWSYRGSGGFRVPAQSAGEEIRRIQRELAQNGRNISDYVEIPPKYVVESARDERSPLHPAFEWDDEVAANKQRVERARQLLRSLQYRTTVVRAIRSPEPVKPQRTMVAVCKPAAPAPVVMEEKPRIAYVAVGTTKGTAAYVDSSLMETDKNVRTRVLRDAINQLRSWRRRYAELTELAGVFREIDGLDDNIAASV